MLSTYISKKNIACIKHFNLFDTVALEMHIHNAIHYRKNFLAIVDVPLIGLIRPMQFDCRAIQAGDR